MNDVRRMCERRIKMNQKQVDDALKGMEEMLKHYPINGARDLLALRINIDNRLEAIKEYRAQIDIYEEVLITMELEEERERRAKESNK